MKNMSSKLARATPLKIARGVYRRARHGLTELGQLDGLPGSLAKLSPYVEHLRRIASQMVGGTPDEAPRPQPATFTFASAEQGDSGAARPIPLPDYGDLRARPARTAPPSR